MLTIGHREPVPVKAFGNLPTGPVVTKLLLLSGTFARLVADHLGTVGSVPKPHGQGRSPVNARTPGNLKSPAQEIYAAAVAIATTAASHMRSPPSPGGNTRSKGHSPSFCVKLPSHQSTTRSPGTSTSTLSGRSPSLDGQSPSLTPSPLAALIPIVTPKSSPSPTASLVGTQQQHPSSSLRVTPVSSLVAPLKCDICNKTFTSRSNLNKHKRVQHSGEEYVCPICRRTFRNRYYIKEHVLLCSTATQKRAAAASATAVLGGTVKHESMTAGSGGEGEGDDEDFHESKVLIEDHDCAEEDQPTNLVLRRTTSPT
ncbi:hypothetical protein SK128_024517 [Halocaridina rubra]|uniref:C2H2-type domain-containing protein n=1 Tax=Halocaridina rubra TaxID=373956 RepID=A0AAN8WRV0_HALRR